MYQRMMHEQRGFVIRKFQQLFNIFLLINKLNVPFIYSTQQYNKSLKFPMFPDFFCRVGK